MERENTAKKKNNAAWYILGSVVVAVGVSLIIPRIIEKGSDLFVKQTTPKQDADDDWGPQIVKTSELEGGNNG